MSRSLTPPGETEKLEAGSVLVLAPHYDDEVLGCGGLVAQLAAAGAAVRVLFLSDGRGGDEAIEDRGVYQEERRREARKAAKVLGISGFDELGLADGALDQHLDAMAAGIRRALLSQRPEKVLVTSPLELSVDHRAAFLALHRVLGSVRPDDELVAALPTGFEVLAYEVNHPLYPNLLIDVSPQIALLEQAMACYPSQQKRHDYLAARLGLLRFRALSLPPGVTAVEAYCRLELQDFTTRGPNGLIAELGGAVDVLRVEEGPLISVIVRTKDRPQLLAEALASLARSSYRRAEVVVVNDGGFPPELPAEYPLALRPLDLDTNQGRAAAANAGVEAARGDYIAFLDDDDLVEPDHLEVLAGLIRGAGVRVVYTDAAVGVYRLGPSSGWTSVERRLPYSHDFDADLLLFDNYIPFHTLLIERQLFAEVGPFDLELPIFEDWDFLIRLAERAAFHHFARVTCEYRHFRGAGHHALGDRPRERDDFLAMKARVLAKHRPRLTPERIARVVDHLKAELVSGQESVASWQRQYEKSEERYHQRNGELASCRGHLEVLAGSMRRSEAENLALRQQWLEHDRELHRVYDREARLDRDIAVQTAKLTELFAQTETQSAQLQAQHEKLGELYAQSELQLAQMAKNDQELLRLYAREEGLTEQLALQDRELQRLHQREEALAAKVDEQADHLGRTYAEIERLSETVRTIRESRWWRLGERLRGPRS